MKSGSEHESRVHFAGPADAPGRLRDLLAERVRAVPAGGRIDFVTYYFRDRRLARELVEARRRGARVRVSLDGHPRTAHANDPVIASLAGSDGIGPDLRVVAGRFDARPLGGLLRPRLHEKLYCFSHPQPAAFVGSFNPSGDEPELDPDVVRALGDQDRGHNLLVEIRDGLLVSGLMRHAERLHAARHGPFDRFAPAANASLRSGALELHFWPRATRSPLLGRLSRLGPGDRLRLVASHLSGPSAQRVLQRLCARGVSVEVLVGGTERRVPPRSEARLRAAGVAIRRAHHPELPMHDKFALLDGRDGAAPRAVVFGSFNWSEPSRRLNRELVAISGEPSLVEAFQARWRSLRALADAAPGSGR